MGHIENLAEGGNTNIGEIMNILLVRFGVMAAGIAVLVLVVFTIAVVLKRRGKLGAARRYVEPLARGYVENRAARRGRGGRRGGGWTGAVVEGVVKYVENQDTGRNRRDDRDGPRR
ncbi:hypothetical protein ACFWY9_37565 [Amycolatopsis sp. NPDC059027]|uniref:hypothetical protein n=1 Tax=unclassified Amycolatopsis TaxID=2618356 RepID=UPI00366E3EBC